MGGAETKRWRPSWRPGKTAVDLAQQGVDARAALALPGLVFGAGTLGGEPSGLGLPLMPCLGFPAAPLALGRDTRREVGDELARGSTPQERAQVGHRVAHTLGTQPAGEFVEQGLRVGGRCAGLVQQPGSGRTLGGEQAIGEDEWTTTTAAPAGAIPAVPTAATATTTRPLLRCQRSAGAGVLLWL